MRCVYCSMLKQVCRSESYIHNTVYCCSFSCIVPRYCCHSNVLPALHASSILFIGQRAFSNTALTAAPHKLIKHKGIIYAGLKSMMVILGIPYTVARRRYGLGKLGNIHIYGLRSALPCRCVYYSQTFPLLSFSLLLLVYIAMPYIYPPTSIYAKGMPTCYL